MSSPKLTLAFHLHYEVIRGQEINLGHLPVKLLGNDYISERSERVVL